MVLKLLSICTDIPNKHPIAYEIIFLTIFSSSSHSILNSSILFSLSSSSCKLYRFIKISLILISAFEYKVGHVSNVPYIEGKRDEVVEHTQQAINISKLAWDENEISKDYLIDPIVSIAKTKGICRIEEAVTDSSPSTCFSKRIFSIIIMRPYSTSFNI